MNNKYIKIATAACILFSNAFSLNVYAQTDVSTHMITEFTEEREYELQCYFYSNFLANYVKDMEDYHRKVTYEQKIHELEEQRARIAYEESLVFGYELQHSAIYPTKKSKRLTRSRGVVYFQGHRETYYSQKVLPGKGLSIPGRHVADDGTIRDRDGYICVAANTKYMKKGTVLLTSLGPAKVYDAGCAYGTIDIYVNW